MGQPLRMAELVAQLDGPIYVERVALFSARERVKARKAIRKALTHQIEGRGYSFIEIIAECPTHLKMTPQEAEEWVKNEMEPVFPLGVKKDLTVEPWFRPGAPVFEAEAVLGLCGATPRGEEEAHEVPPWPSHLPARDIAIKFAGSGGDGAQTAALLLTRAAIAEGYDATDIPSYGPESRGGTSYADVHIAEREVLNPAASEPHVLIAFNAPSLAKFAGTVPAGGMILYDSTIITAPPALSRNRRMFPVPFTRIAADLGRPMVKNVVALGALQAALNLLPEGSIPATLHYVLKDKPVLLPLNEAAFAAGREAVEAILAPA
jgi:2-oxoisovalerate ferredoxin oxidoreductase beta subunit